MATDSITYDKAQQRGIIKALGEMSDEAIEQSKKDQIQSLNYRIDSLSNIIIVERQEMDKLQIKIQESKSLLQDFESKKDSLSKELNKSN